MSTKKLRELNISKTNAMRELDSAGIKYKFDSYEYDEKDLSGIHAAEMLGVDEDIIFKTIVTISDDNCLSVFMLPVAEHLDLKKAAKVSGHKKIELVHVKDIEKFTGYVRGGCSPIGMKKSYQTFIDETAILYDEIYFSAGKRGLQIILDPNVLAEFVNAEFSDLCL